MNKKTAKNNAVKQLNSTNQKINTLSNRFRALEMAANNKLQSRARKSNNKRSGRKVYRATTDIPVTTAYTLRNNTATQRHVESAQEFIGVLRISGSTPSGTTAVYPMNPLDALFNSTRLQNLAKSYGKYRFTRMKLTIASNFSTTISGSIIAGYMENPDQLLFSNNDPNAIIRQVYATKGAISKSLWTPIDILGRISDRKKWYNLDDTSDEVMSTTQGKFVVVVQSPVAVSAQVDVPIMLEYTIELMEPSVQNIGFSSLGSPETYPSANFIARSSEQEGQFHLNSGGKAITSGAIYYINGGHLLTIAGTSDSVVANYMGYYDSTGYSTGFYNTLEDASGHKEGIPVVLTGGNFATPALTIQRLNG